tara:strand:- start:4169 stop:4420 length:252 start_codon:yes stop_codon:yes gene_type:complete
MFIGDKDVIKDNESFFDRLRKEVQNDLYDHILSDENERRRKRGLAEKNYFSDTRTKEQIEKDTKKKLKALEIAKKATLKEFSK